MNDDFNASADSGDAFTAEEQALFDGQMGEGAAPKPASGSDAAGAADGALAPVAPAGAPAGEPAAPGEVVDPEVEDGGADENKGKFVRHGAFHQERERRKAVERERDEFRVQMARMEERLRLFTQAGQPPAAPAPQAAPEPVVPPDPNEDIFGAYAHLQAELQALKTGQSQLSETQKAEREAQAQAHQRNEVLSTYRGDVQRVMAAQPEFAEAYEHLFSGRIAELKLLGVPEADAVQAVRDEEFGIVQAALQSRQSPAERLMQLAKLRGFAPKAPEPVAPAAPSETPAQKADRLARGQAASKSLSAAGGAPAGELTQEMLLHMSEAEFERVSEANPARVRALMGG